MAVHLGTTVEATAGGAVLQFRSDDEAGTVLVRLPVGDPAAVEPVWGRYVAGGRRAGTGGGRHRHGAHHLPIGAGLSSSAALEVATALALGFDGSPLGWLGCASERSADLQVPCGIMDMLASAAGVEGQLLLIDCSTESVTPVPSRREPRWSSYTLGRGAPWLDRLRRPPGRRGEQPRRSMSPLRAAHLADLDRIDDEVVRRDPPRAHRERAHAASASSRRCGRPGRSRPGRLAGGDAGDGREEAVDVGRRRC